MKSIKIAGAAIALSVLAACSSGNDEAANANANVALESENLDAGLDANVATDANLGADLNAAADANAAGNASDAAGNNAADAASANAQ